MRTRSRRRDLENKDLAAPTNSSPPKPMQWTGYPSWFIYEDPRKLEEQLKEAEQRLEEIKAAGMDDIIDISQEVAELRDRVNFAWQDEEFDQQQSY